MSRLLTFRKCHYQMTHFWKALGYTAKTTSVEKFSSQNGKGARLEIISNFAGGISDGVESNFIHSFGISHFFTFRLGIWLVVLVLEENSPFFLLDWQRYEHFYVLRETGGYPTNSSWLRFLFLLICWLLSMPCCGYVPHHGQRAHYALL
ncbi:hypothetical protein MPH_05476 [Macrophomina phaseolina MS6]|uniref:Uncharacterized protein n=1 Tax=Macrophomina phaseolina (strain MS6) TaxID=1126212 RepID=K2R4G1_MACPH|nr:hypothetical protein MPH_05476 [Macrophomina phaseolina MS6]